MHCCPKCELVCEETESGTCPVCGSVLLSVDELPAEDRDRLVVLRWCENVGEAQVLRAALGAEGIDAIVEEEGLIAWVNPNDARGGATDTRVLIRLEDAEAALDLLRRKEAGELALSEEDFPGAEEEEEPD